MTALLNPQYIRCVRGDLDRRRVSERRADSLPHRTFALPQNQKSTGF
jgi:hypothetical protein